MTTLTIFVACVAGCVIGTLLADWVRWHRVSIIPHRRRYRRGDQPRRGKDE